jgi:hypothetical protein
VADITYSVAMNVNKGLLRSDVAARGITASMTSDSMLSASYSLSTTAASISTANLSLAGIAVFRNLSSSTASTAQLGFQVGGSFASFCTLKAGEAAVIRMTAGRQYEAIGTSGTRLRVDITEG